MTAATIIERIPHELIKRALITLTFIIVAASFWLLLETVAYQPRTEPAMLRLPVNADCL